MKDKLPKIGLLIGSFILFIIISEILLGFAGLNYYPVDIDVNISEKDRIFRLNKTSGYYETVENKLLAGVGVNETLYYKFEYQKFKAEKEPGTYRIFVLGGSSIYLLALASDNFYLEYAKDRFKNLYPDKELEIIFAGGAGCGTYELKKVNQEVLEYESDLIILYSGHNEFLFPVEKKYYFEQKDLTEIINENLEKFRLYQLLSNIILPIKNSLGINNEISEISDLYEGDCHIKGQMVYDSYRSNIENMIRTAKNKNVDFMVSTASYNHMNPPFLGPFVETLSDISMYIDDFGKLTMNFSREKRKKIEHVLDIMVNKSNIEEESLNEYRIGLKYYEEGQFKKAKEHFEMAIILECFPLRANNITNRMVRELAKEYDIPLADVELAMLEETEHNITTYEQFNDHCHLKSEGNEILLDTFLKTIKENNLVE